LPPAGAQTRIGPVPLDADPDAVRAAALAWLSQVTLEGELAIRRETLANDFRFHGERFPLIDRGQGIRKPGGWDAALSITTAASSGRNPRPYDDAPGPDGLLRYKRRRDEGGRAVNLGLRAAMTRGLPLIWFYGVAPSSFQAIFPVYLVAEEPEFDQFVLALTEDQRRMPVGTPVEESLRRYLMAQTRRRLHQPVFASQVMAAYDTHCAVCNLAHRSLLDAAHIVPDTAPGGEPTVVNGLALCKIHHAAYDANVLGIRPDYVVQIHRRLLEEIDGPMLRHGLQDHHGRSLMAVPARRADRPDPQRLAHRFEEFRVA
jgi:putative restriction endonuclease